MSIRHTGLYLVRYRVFDLFGLVAASSSSSNVTAATLAECYSSVPLRIYDTKHFPGLSAVTPLTEVRRRVRAKLRVLNHALQLVAKQSKGARPHARPTGNRARKGALGS